MERNGRVPMPVCLSPEQRQEPPLCVLCCARNWHDVRTCHGKYREHGARATSSLSLALAHALLGASAAEHGKDLFFFFLSVVFLVTKKSETLNAAREY